MMKIESSERSTGMGARHYSAVLVRGRFVRVSEMEGKRYHGRTDGYENYSVLMPDGTIWAQFYRSNSGKETVTIHANGRIIDLNSFDDAQTWAGEQNGKSR